MTSRPRSALMKLLRDCAEHHAVLVGDGKNIHLVPIKASRQRHNESVVWKRPRIGVDGDTHMFTPLVSRTEFRPAHQCGHLEEVGYDRVRDCVAESGQRVCESLVRLNVELNHRDACEQPRGQPWLTQKSRGEPGDLGSAAHGASY